MTCDWCNVEVKCPTCRKHGVLQFVQVSGDGEFRFTAFCQGCQIIIQWKVFSSQLIYMATMNDVEASRKQGENINHPQPLQLPAPLYTVEDQKFFRDMKIGEEDAA